MKKLLTLAAIFALVFTTCEDPTEDNTPKLPNLTIRNESSYVLTNVKFSNIAFASSGSDLMVSGQSVKQLTSNDLNKAGFITFTRKDIGIALRTEAISIGSEDHTFTFTDNTSVEEQTNSGNKNSLSQISFLSKVTVELGGLSVPKNDIVEIEEFAGFTKQNEFTLKNTGVGKLLLTGTQPVKITGTGADAFLVVQPTSSEIAPNSSLTFKINFSPGAVQVYNATVTVNSNDRDGDFTFTIRARGVTPKPIATVLYENSEIAQNGTINADEVLITLSKSITVFIKNTGVEVLTLDTANITITGADAEAFIKTTNPGGSISIGGQTSFIIECKPTKQGENNAVLTIPTNDNSRNPVVVYLKVTGVKGSAVLELSQASTPIGNNSLTPFDFGRVEIGTVKNLSFTIINTGNIALNLSETSLITSSNTAFEIQSQPVTKTLIPGASVSFTVRFTPTAEAEATAFIDIPNDSDEGQFTLNVTGTGYVKRPQIIVQQGVSPINPHGEYNFGTVALGENKDITFYIENTGEANLNIISVNGSRINLEDNTDGLFSVIQQPSAVVIPGNSTNFIVRFSPTVEENNFTATVHIKTDSQDNDEFYFLVKGAGYIKRPQISISQVTTMISPNGEYDFDSLLFGTTKDVIFTITNLGEANLNFVSVKGNNASLVNNTGSFFSIIQQPLTTTLAPGYTTTFTIRFNPTTIGNNYSATVTIITDSQNNSEFSFRVKGNGRNYAIGDTGPGGGLIFSAEGGQFKECSGELGQNNWANAKTVASNYRGGGFTNWRLPDRGELSLMYQNLYAKGLGGFSTDSTISYWSSVESSADGAWYSSFYHVYRDGYSESTFYKTNSLRVRAVRTF